MVIRINRKRKFRESCAVGSPFPTAPSAEADSVVGKAEESRPDASLPREEWLLLSAVFLFFLAVAGIGLLLGYAALTSLPMAQH